MHPVKISMDIVDIDTKILYILVYNVVIHLKSSKTLHDARDCVL